MLLVCSERKKEENNGNFSTRWGSVSFDNGISIPLKFVTWNNIRGSKKKEERLEKKLIYSFIETGDMAGY
jgi:hypothetical protein